MNEQTKDAITTLAGEGWTRSEMVAAFCDPGMGAEAVHTLCDALLREAGTMHAIFGDDGSAKA